MHAGPELAIVLLVCLTLVLGAALHSLCKRLGFPYTVAMLLAGMAGGTALERAADAGVFVAATHLLSVGSKLSPELIVFVFLPLLVFESAFDIDVHAFRRNVWAVLVLAGPALLIATGATAAVMVGLTSTTWHWGWLPALVFGALISATDPVAVVALLRSLGAPKRLALMIEGESLLNDGTAIVVFTLLMSLLTGQAQFDLGSSALELLRVTWGGVMVGLILAIATSAWLSRVFNAPLIEITLTLALAYLAMLLGEGVLHVSGVMAVVVAGLWMSGPGRVQISPEVMHFLHRFWGMLAYLANTLIFFLVGIVIAGELSGVGLVDIGLILAAFVAVMVIRVVLLYSFRPILAPLCHGLSPRETAVVAWGGLRGAVSLALGLVVASQRGVPPELRRQILLMTAGVVLLTILVNGTTMGALLRRMGFDKKPPADRLAQHVTRSSALVRVREQVEQSSRSPDLRTVAWDELRRELDRDCDEVDEQITATRAELSALDPRERARGVWRQVLRVERTAYWAAFASGTIVARAARILNREIDVQLDRIAAGDDEPPERRVRELPGWLDRTRRWMWRAARPFGRVEFELMALRYDLWRAESMAAERVLAALAQLDGIEPDVRDEVRDTYRSYRLRSKQQLEDMRAHLPELTREIETRLAQRIRLNLERDGYDALEHSGVLDPESAASTRAAVEHRMKRLAHQRLEVNLPETAELCRHAPLFEELDDAGIDLLADLTVEKAVSAGDVLFEQGSSGDSMLVIARGAVSITREVDGEEQLLAVVGGGDVVGEMALLTGEPRNATARALTTVTLGVVSRSDLDDLLERQPSLKIGIWRSYARRALDNLLHDEASYGALDETVRRAWLEAAELHTLQSDEPLPTSPLVFLASGALQAEGEPLSAPRLVESRPSDSLHAAIDGTRVLLLPPPPWQRGKSGDQGHEAA